jgi:mono/diheme cytochrome c family protein
MKNTTSCPKRFSRYLACALLSAHALAAGAADIENGRRLHDERCLLCHGLEHYETHTTKIQSLDALREMVKRWEDKLKDPFTIAEREDVVAYLNSAFYHLPQLRKSSR